MIYTRTKQDVINALKIRKNKVEKGIDLTYSEQATLERGMLTITTLNRVELKQNELKGIINSMGYWNTPIVSKTWRYSNFFNRTDLDRISSNNKVLREAFYALKDTPSNPKLTYSFLSWNDLEKILEDLETMASEIKEQYRECGTVECGG